MRNRGGRKKKRKGEEGEGREQEGRLGRDGECGGTEEMNHDWQDVGCQGGGNG